MKKITYTPCYRYVKFNNTQNEYKRFKQLLTYFTEYSSSETDRKYYHNGENFEIIVYDNNSVFQTNSDHERQGVELDTIDNFKIRFKSFTGEDLY